MDKTTGTCPRFDQFVTWLGSKDAAKNRMAATILSRLGRPGMEELVVEAVAPGKQPDHRIAILDVVARIGVPLGPDEFFALQTLLRHRVPRVREKAAEVFVALSPGGMPNSPCAAAFMRAFHPAFWTPPCHRRKSSPRREYNVRHTERVGARGQGEIAGNKPMGEVGADRDRPNMVT